MKTIAITLIKIVLVLALTLGIGKEIYQSGIPHKIILHPIGSKVYTALRPLFGFGCEGSGDLVMSFVLGFSLITAILLVWAIFHFARRYQMPKT